MPKLVIGVIFLLVLIVFDVGTLSTSGLNKKISTQKEKSCREHPGLVGRCFNVNGRLSVYNGAPALRIRKVGTRRMLGISEQRFQVEGYRNIPEDIKNQINQDVDIFAGFLVCPFTRPKPREMQLVCVESAKNPVVRKREQ